MRASLWLHNCMHTDSIVSVLQVTTAAGIRKLSQSILSDSPAFLGCLHACFVATAGAIQFPYFAGRCAPRPTNANGLLSDVRGETTLCIRTTAQVLRRTKTTTEAYMEHA